MDDVDMVRLFQTLSPSQPAKTENQVNILINAANLSGGGGAQVADSICGYLCDYPQHQFTVVLSQRLDFVAKKIRAYPNVKVERYGFNPGDLKTLITFRNKFLDHIVERDDIDCVLTVFGPVKWRPKRAHVCGFALSQIVIPESPFFQRMNWKQRLKWKKTIGVWKYIFRRSADVLITENPLITERLKKIMPGKHIETISNNYNQVFDQPGNWKIHTLPLFAGTSLLDITSPGSHKNNEIALDVARILKVKHPDFKFRFVFTFERESFPAIPQELEDCFLFIGRVAIAECPSLYKQCDIEFQPTLLECFTATFPEGMRMGTPIVTCDLEFARGLCGDAALYYDPLSAESAAECIYRLATEPGLRRKLIEAGKRQLQQFDTNRERADKSIKLCEDIVNNWK